MVNRILFAVLLLASLVLGRAAASDEPDLCDASVDLEAERKEVLAAPFDAQGVAVSQRSRRNAALEARLKAARVSVAFNATPAKDICAELQRLTGIPVQFENEDNGLQELRLQLANVSARSVLGHLARLTSTLPVYTADGVLLTRVLTERNVENWIAGQDAHGRNCECWAFDVTAVEAARLDPVEWIKLIAPHCVEGNCRSLTCTDGRLVVCADRNALDFVAKLVAALREFAVGLRKVEPEGQAPGKVLRPNAAPWAGVHADLHASERAWSAANAEKLKKKVSFEFVDVPLEEAVDYLADETGLNIVMDSKLQMGLPAEKPRVGAHIAIAGGVLVLALILWVLGKAVWRRQRPRFSLRYLMLMMLAGSILGYGAVRYHRVTEEWTAYRKNSGDNGQLNLRVSDMSADLALDWTVRMASLEKTCRDEALYVDVPERLIDDSEPHLYYLRDLQSAYTGVDFLEVLKEIVHPELLDPALGTFMVERKGILCAQHFQNIHPILEHLFAQWRRHAGEVCLDLGAWVEEGDPVRREIEAELQHPVTVEIKGEVLENFSNQFSLSNNVSVEPTVEKLLVTFSAKDTPAGDAARQMLQAFHCELNVVDRKIVVGSHAFTHPPQRVLFDFSRLTYEQFNTLRATLLSLPSAHLAEVLKTPFLAELNDVDRAAFQKKVDEVLGKQERAEPPAQRP